jgi:prevent-host-death family protein
LTNSTNFGTIHLVIIMKTISASKARTNLYKILNEVKNGLKSYTITLRGEAQAVIINPEELEAWQETLDILSDNKLTAQIFKSQEDIKKGEYISEDNLIKELNIPNKSQ